MYRLFYNKLLKAHEYSREFFTSIKEIGASTKENIKNQEDLKKCTEAGQMKIINSMNNISGAVQRASIMPNQRPSGAPTNLTVSTPNPAVGPTSRPVIDQPNPATIPPANTPNPNPHPNFPEFKVISNISKRINDTNPPKYVLSQLNTVVDKLKYKEKYARVGAEFTKVIAFYGVTSECYIVNYASAIAGELGYEYIEASGMVLEANVTRIVKLFEEARKSNKSTVVLITNAYMIGNQQANNGSRDAEIALKAELASDKNSNLVIILQTTGTSLKFFYNLTNGMAVNFNYPTFGDGGTLEDRENFIRQILIKKNIPFDFDLDLRDFADRAIGLSRISIERSIQRAAEKMTVLGHTKITLDAFDLAAEEIIHPTIDQPIFSEERQEKTAIHEAGHTLIAYLNGEKFVFVTILSGNRGSSGKMQYAFNYDFCNISELKNRLCTYLGGRAAEELYGGGVREGIAVDITLVKDLAKKLGTFQKTVRNHY